MSKTKDNSGFINEEEYIMNDQSSFHFPLDEAKYSKHGSINIVSSKKHTPFADVSKSNEDLEEFTSVNKIIQMNRPKSNQREVHRAKAVFRASGDITSREQRARVIAK